MKIFNKTLLAAGIFAVAGVANALPITGAIGFGGTYKTDTGLLATATTISNIKAVVIGPVTGSFTADGIFVGDTASYSDFTFDPITTPVNSLWSVGHFSFNLTQMNVNSHTAGFLNLSGSGMVSSTNDGLDPTPGYWKFSADSIGDNFTWSDLNVVAPKSVPEPTAALLLGAGLIGFGVARKARKTRKAA